MRTRTSSASANSSAGWSRTARSCGCAARTPAAPARGWPTSRSRCGTPRAATPGSSTPARSLTADVGHSRPSVLSIGVDDPVIDLYVVAGADPAARLTAYTALTGRPDVPPPWAFGYWMGRCRYHTSEEMLEVGRTMREHEVPLDVLHLDPDWLVVDRLNTDFIWNTDRFGDRKQFIADLADLGIRLSVWELPYLDPASPDLRGRRARGLPRRADRRQPRRHRQDADPRRADAGPHRLHQPRRPARGGRRCTATSSTTGSRSSRPTSGRRCPTTSRSSTARPPHQAHNLYPLRYNGAVSRRDPRVHRPAAAGLGRSGWAGSQRYPGQWGGDAESTVAGMQATVRGGLSYAMSAPGSGATTSAASSVPS